MSEVLTESRRTLRTLWHSNLDGIALLFENDTVILRHRLGSTSHVKSGSAVEDIGECVPARRQWLNEFRACFHSNVEQPDRRIGKFLHAVDALALATDDLDLNFAIIRHSIRDFRVTQVAITRLASFQ